MWNHFIITIQVLHRSYKNNFPCQASNKIDMDKANRYTSILIISDGKNKQYKINHSWKMYPKKKRLGMVPSTGMITSPHTALRGWAVWVCCWVPWERSEGHQGFIGRVIAGSTLPQVYWSINTTRIHCLNSIQHDTINILCMIQKKERKFSCLYTFLCHGLQDVSYV